MTLHKAPLVSWNLLSEIKCLSDNEEFFISFFCTNLWQQTLRQQFNGKRRFFLFILTLNSFHLYISFFTHLPPYIALWIEREKFRKCNKKYKSVIFCTDVSNPYNNFPFSSSFIFAPQAYYEDSKKVKKNSSEWSCGKEEKKKGWSIILM